MKMELPATATLSASAHCTPGVTKTVANNIDIVFLLINKTFQNEG